MPLTIVHVLVAYLAALPFRKNLNMAAVLIAAALPDLESLYYAVQALQVCTTAQCLAEWPSHFLLHSFLGLALIIAPLAATAAIWLRDRNFGKWRQGLPLIYLSAIAGGLLHFLPDLTVHSGADALHLLWPAMQTFEFTFLGAGLLWDIVAVVGALALIWTERSRASGLTK